MTHRQTISPAGAPTVVMQALFTHYRRSWRLRVMRIGMLMTFDKADELSAQTATSI